MDDIVGCLFARERLATRVGKVIEQSRYQLLICRGLPSHRIKCRFRETQPIKSMIIPYRAA